MSRAQEKTFAFKCPTCAGTKLEEVMTDIKLYTELEHVTRLPDGGVVVSYEDSLNEGGEVECYQCASCGYILKAFDDDGDPTGSPIHTQEELANWLEVMSRE